MLLEFSKGKDGEKICCLGTWKWCTFEPGVWKAANLLSGETQQTDPFFCTAGNNLSLGDLLSVRPLPGVGSSCPTLELLWCKFICRGRVLRVFQSNLVTNALLEHRVRPTDRRGLVVMQDCILPLIALWHLSAPRVGWEKDNAWSYSTENCLWVEIRLEFKARTKPSGYNSEIYHNLLIVVFSRVIPHGTWIKKSSFLPYVGNLPSLKTNERLSWITKIWGCSAERRNMNKAVPYIKMGKTASGNPIAFFFISIVLWC